MTQRNDFIEFLIDWPVVVSMSPFFFALTTFCDKMSTMSVLFGICYFFVRIELSSEKYSVADGKQKLCAFNIYEMANKKNGKH